MSCISININLFSKKQVFPLYTYAFLFGKFDFNFTVCNLVSTMSRGPHRNPRRAACGSRLAFSGLAIDEMSLNDYTRLKKVYTRLIQKNTYKTLKKNLVRIKSEFSCNILTSDKPHMKRA